MNGQYLRAARLDLEPFVSQRLYYDLSSSFPEAMSFQAACRRVMSALPEGATFPKRVEGLPPDTGKKLVLSSMYGTFGKGSTR